MMHWWQYGKLLEQIRKIVIKFDDNKKAFFALVRTGLWENYQKLRVESSELRDTVDWEKVYQLASEQTVLGLALAGIERLKNHNNTHNLNIPQMLLLQWIGEVQMIEEQNKEMNAFIRKLVEDMRKDDIYALLVKGQGVAQCYEHPLWRASGDVDLLLSDDNYEKAKAFMTKIASYIEPERVLAKHIGFTVDQWTVELHAPAPESLKRPIYNVMANVWRSIFNMGNVRVWNNDGVSVFIPSPNNDIIIVFTHFLGHFCFGGIGLRQICDLCRLLWVYRDEIDHNLLKKRLDCMGLMTEWKVFASLMVNWLGMPEETMPFYSNSAYYKRKATRACDRILRTGDMGVKEDDSYRLLQPKWRANLITLRRRLGEFFGLLTLFPVDAPRFFGNYLMQKMKGKVEKE